ncbi:MAG: hypothetical protein WCZ89_02670 [Phycisphaerae bacterium]
MQSKKQTGCKMFCLFLSTFLLINVCFADENTAGSVMDLVPSDAVFCVRLNNFDYTMGQFDQFLSGVTPIPGAASIMVRMPLVSLLGDPALSGVNTSGIFAMFGVPAKPQNESEQTKNIFGVMLLPVKDYQLFLESSINVDEPDAAGISRITPQTMGGGKSGKRAICIKVKDYALIGPEENYVGILALAKSISSGSAGSIAKSLDAEQTKYANEMPVWAYGDIEKINKVFGSVINDIFTKAQAEIENKSKQGQPMMGNASQMMKVYFDMAKAFLEQGKYASISLKPEPAVLRIKKILTAKADTEMAKTLSADESLPKENMLIDYMQDGAAINCSAKIGQNTMQKMMQAGMSFMKASPTMASEEQKAEWEQIFQDTLDSAGNVLAASIKVNPTGKPSFAMNYLLEIKDKQKYENAQDKAFEMMKTGSMAEMYKQMGLKLEVEHEKNAMQYKNVSIDSAKLMFKVIDVNSPEAQMIASIYGEGFVYKMAYVDKYYAMVMGGDTEAGIKQLIDQIKIGSKSPSSEVKTAMEILPAAKTVDFFGTANVIRMMNLGMSFAPMPVAIPFDKIPTKTNIAFTGIMAQGKLTLDIAVPKEHLAEIASIGTIMQQQMMENQSN